jgi:hypothetical protein
MAFVGFSALISVFQRDPGVAGAAIVRGALIANIVELGFAALFFALLPSLLKPVGWAEPLVWRVASGLLAVFLAAYMSMMVRRRSRVTSGPSRTLRRDAVFVPIAIASGLLVLALLANAFGFYRNGGPATYLLGVVWLLGMAAFFFLALLNLFGPPRRPEA